MTDAKRELAVRVSVVRDPARSFGVLLQLPDGYVVMSPSDSRRIAAALLNASDELEGMRDE